MLTLVLSIVMGLGVGGIAFVILFSMHRKHLPTARESSFEAERRAKLESASGTYRTFQILVVELARLNRQLYGPEGLERITDCLSVEKELTLWRAEEFLATRQLESAIAGTIVGVIAAALTNVTAAIVVGAVVGIFNFKFAVTSLRDRAAQRRRRVKGRLPFVVDLLALIIEAGGTFQDGLETLVRENRDSPLGEELSLLQREIELGRPRAEALHSLQERIPDDDVREFVFAVNQGEILGTPLATILRSQADQMRLKRTQWVEKAAAEAHVKIAFPGFVVMLGCILVILGPIVLPAIFAVLEAT